MAPQLVFETTFVVAAGVLEAIYVLKLLYNAAFRHRLSLRQCCKSCANYFTAVLATCKVGSRQGDALLEKQVVEAVAHFRLRSFSVLLFFCWILTGLTVVSIQYNILLKTERWMTDALTGTVGAIFAICTAGQVIPAIVKTRFLDAWYSLFGLMFIATLSHYHLRPEQLVSWSMMLSVFRIAIFCIPSRFSLVALFHTFFSVHIIWRFSTESFPASATQGEVVMFAFALTSSWTLRKFVEWKVRTDIIRSGVYNELSAATSLLSYLCDAVFQLDPQLKFTDGAPQLSAMLLRSTTARSLAGTEFQALLASAEEQSRFATQLLGSSGNGQHKSEGPRSSAFHVDLVDSCGSIVQTEVFHVCFRGADTYLRHLVGLREHTDVLPLAGPCLEARTEKARFDKNLFEASACANAPSELSSPTLSLSQKSLAQLDRASSASLLCFDTADLTILAASNALWQDMGVWPVGNKLTDFFIGEEMTKVLNAIRDAEHGLHSGTQDGYRICFKSLVMQREAPVKGPSSGFIILWVVAGTVLAMMQFTDHVPLNIQTPDSSSSSNSSRHSLRSKRSTSKSSRGTPRHAGSTPLSFVGRDEPSVTQLGKSSIAQL